MNQGIREILADNLKKNRRKWGLTQEQFAEKANLSTNYIAMIETCKKYPKPDMLEQIARTLEIEPYMLFYVETELNEPLERLHRKIIADMKELVITDMKQMVSEAVEKAATQCKDKQ